MLDVLKQQYSFIRSTREMLFTFLEEIPLQKLHSTVPNFGSGSIIKTHIHVADCYRYWLGSFAFNQRRADFSFATDYEIEHSNVEKVRARFELVDEIVQRFLDEFNARWFENIANEVKWQKEPWSTTPLWLLTHTETHEFHHKGQIVSMARHLGYIPPNTDLD
ncbi:DinB family protein [Bacillus pseudomycoides]|uniref:DinB family protein n=1 Tax=Bacillus pseudomycoides TaxID=64104 RepID=UPI000BED1012|nr:DinB family protein [Bacillus pseudomycoides]PEE39729.1 damage-inducible protein DinB [Bacillus pseudomycoides]PGA90660.1 damage-inducible protein DinB [Bacillus pseudomycoides]PHF40778.1 damage-inducible protein DinB [Bacillus pseudomycoides]